MSKRPIIVAGTVEVAWLMPSVRSSALVLAALVPRVGRFEHDGHQPPCARVPSCVPVAVDHPDESFRVAIRDGVSPHHWDFGPMPAVSGLADDEITAIIAYIREVQQREGFEPYPPD